MEANRGINNAKEHPANKFENFSFDILYFRLEDKYFDWPGDSLYNDSFSSLGPNLLEIAGGKVERKHEDNRQSEMKKSPMRGNRQAEISETGLKKPKQILRQQKTLHELDLKIVHLRAVLRHEYIKRAKGKNLRRIQTLNAHEEATSKAYINQSCRIDRK